MKEAEKKVLRLQQAFAELIASAATSDEEGLKELDKIKADDSIDKMMALYIGMELAQAMYKTGLEKEAIDLTGMIFMRACPGIEKGEASSDYQDAFERNGEKWSTFVALKVEAEKRGLN